MREKKDALMFDADADKEIAARIDAAAAEHRQKSLKRIIADVYPNIRAALEKGLTRSQLYEIILTPEQRERISERTFIGYYQAARRAALKSGGNGNA